MSVTFEADGGFMRVKLAGKVTFEDIRHHLEEIAQHPSFRPGMNSLWDLRDVAVAGVEATTLRRVASFAELNQELRRGTKTAIVVSTEADFGVARMYEAFAASLPWEVQAFRTVDQARRWLAEPQPSR